MKRLSKTLISAGLLAIVAIASPARVFADRGNGSGGVGNGIYLGEDLDALLPEGAVHVQSGEIRDGDTGESLMRLEHVRRKDLRKYGRRLSRSKLGQVDGFEFIPLINDHGVRNFWVSCPPENEKAEAICTKLVPTSKGNTKVLGVIGSLRRHKTH